MQFVFKARKACMSILSVEEWNTVKKKKNTHTSTALFHVLICAHPANTLLRANSWGKGGWEEEERGFPSSPSLRLPFLLDVVV